MIIPIKMKSTIVVLLIVTVLSRAAVEYNLEQSKMFQKYAVITHCSRELLTNWSCIACKTLNPLKDFRYFKQDNLNIVGYLGYHEAIDKIIIVFRGTEDIKNWIQDFSYAQFSYGRCSGCKIHDGWYASYLSVAPQMLKLLNQVRSLHPNKKIVCVGSSEGAALALITAMELQATYQSVDELHVFGCPRVGNQNTVMYLKRGIPKIIRVIHNRDIVPHVPLVSQNYAHPPYEIFFDQGMDQYKICNENGEDPTCSNQFYPNFSIPDHISYWTKPLPSQICSN